MWHKEPPSCGEVAGQIGYSEIAARILIHRLRVMKFRTLLKDEIARTVLTPEEISGELAWLQSVLAKYVRDAYPRFLSTHKHHELTCIKITRLPKLDRVARRSTHLSHCALDAHKHGPPSQDF